VTGRKGQAELEWQNETVKAGKADRTGRAGQAEQGRHNMYIGEAE
jgi:hypothetical protein